MDFLKSDNGKTTILVVTTLAMACVVAASFHNALQNITVVLP